MRVKIFHGLQFITDNRCFHRIYFIFSSKISPVNTMLFSSSGQRPYEVVIPQRPSVVCRSQLRKNATPPRRLDGFEPNLDTMFP